MERGSLVEQKTHLGRNPKVCSVFGVRCALLPGRSPRRDVTRGHSGTACGVLVNTSVYLKPIELLDVALDVLARLAPCLNLGVGELGHKDLLDTIGADNRRK